MYADFPNVILGWPVIRNPPVNQQLVNLFTKYFGTVYTEQHYGCFCLVDDGDWIWTAGVIEHALLTKQGACDNSFVRYTIILNANADNDSPIDPYEEVHYG
ncbi:hypothetical protein FRC06_006820, partial [Ceratobasidium sp. 370]